MVHLLGHEKMVSGVINCWQNRNLNSRCDTRFLVPGTLWQCGCKINSDDLIQRGANVFFWRYFFYQNPQVGIEDYYIYIIFYNYIL